MVGRLRILHVHITCHTGKDGLQVGNRLLGENQGGECVGLDFRIAIADQFVGIRGHEGDIVAGKFAEHAHHMGSQVVVASGEECLADGALQHRGLDVEETGILHRADLGELLAVEARGVVLAVGGRELQHLVLLVNDEHYRGLRNQFQRVDQNLGRNGDGALALHVVQLDDGGHRGLQIRRGKGHLAVFDSH